MDLSKESLDLIVQQLISWGPWGAALLVFMIFGMPHVAPIIAAIGTIFNERHKTNLSHKRSMGKIENQVSGPKAGKETKK
ncbi:hypothetical protein NKI78_04575 [Mesorhizobium sp. M0400]|uniref:hypothetical protein n=1 Tax=Mesorhizobium sp. M0400 TaxID=2956941 RepID=UPI00333BF073